MRKGVSKVGLQRLWPEQMRLAGPGKRLFGEGVQEFCFGLGKLEVPVDSYAKVLTISSVKMGL